MKLKTAALVFVMSSVSLSHAASPQEKYILRRDVYVHQFEKEENPSFEKNTQAIKELEAPLRELVGPVHVDGFSGPGQTNLETFINEVGFGKVDGMRFETGGELMVVTTKSLLSRYIKSSQNLPRDLDALSKNELFYSLVLYSDAGFSMFGELPVAVKANKPRARAFLTEISQDDGPYVPKYIAVYAEKGNQVRVLKADIKGELKPIPACEDIWNAAEKKNRDTAYGLYRDCFSEKVKSDPLFPAVVAQAQSILERLQKD